MNSSGSSPLSAGVRDRSAVALCCRISFTIVRGLSTFRGLQPRYRQRLILLHYNDSDQFLYTMNGSILSWRW